MKWIAIAAVMFSLAAMPTRAASPASTDIQSVLAERNRLGSEIAAALQKVDYPEEGTSRGSFKNRISSLETALGYLRMDIDSDNPIEISSPTLQAESNLKRAQTVLESANTTDPQARAARLEAAKKRQAQLKEKVAEIQPQLVKELDQLSEDIKNNKDLVEQELQKVLKPGKGQVHLSMDRFISINWSDSNGASVAEASLLGLQAMGTQLCPLKFGPGKNKIAVKSISPRFACARVGDSVLLVDIKSASNVLPADLPPMLSSLIDLEGLAKATSLDKFRSTLDSSTRLTILMKSPADLPPDLLKLQQATVETDQEVKLFENPSPAGIKLITLEMDVMYAKADLEIAQTLAEVAKVTSRQGRLSTIALLETMLDKVKNQKAAAGAVHRAKAAELTQELRKTDPIWTTTLDALFHDNPAGFKRGQFSTQTELQGEISWTNPKDKKTAALTLKFAPSYAMTEHPGMISAGENVWIRSQRYPDGNDVATAYCGKLELTLTCKNLKPNDAPAAEDLLKSVADLERLAQIAMPKP